MQNNLIKGDSVKNTQKYLGNNGFIIFIAFLGAFIPLSTKNKSYD